ncbi:DUF2490 domain-containing protein [Saccharicrinis fermentans]|uniref:DUF2490 domain-containing protein n=1 Tax=Saccharicrinis fermentans DSM 9555 = JCM 21142 TaxID=869213 RepID=W7YG95_9BACT|nr:DUF2490 domain-containing protein [Saccharicrinis fermentans]GAF01604.1 hypothetical protein JCM21142_216 [Saccharicrinis fermentans DSM 9555 = JCM 21142]
MKTSKHINVGCWLVVLLLVGNYAIAQDVENEYQTRTELKLSFKPWKKVKVNVSPQLRFDESFTLDKSLIEGELEYKVLDLLTLGAAYRFIANQREKKDTEYLSRYSYSATAEKDFNRFEGAFRLMYSNYADDDDDDVLDFLRYKLSIKYDIAKCKITPSVSTELFQELNGSSVYKMRYSVGADYKLFKGNYLGVDYKFDYYKSEYRNKHIVSVGYKIKF